MVVVQESGKKQVTGEKGGHEKADANQFDLLLLGWYLLERDLLNLLADLLNHQKSR